MPVQHRSLPSLPRNVSLVYAASALCFCSYIGKIPGLIQQLHMCKGEPRFMAEDGSEWVQSQVAHGVNDMVLPLPPSRQTPAPSFPA
jgi:hypothetical protein